MADFQFDLGAASRMAEAGLPAHLGGGRTSGPERLYVEFYMEAERDDRASDGWTETFQEPQPDGMMLARVKAHPGAGRDIWREVEYVKIMTPGDQLNVICKRVTDIEKRRFPMQYAAFKAGVDQQAVNGTLLSQWSPMRRSLVKEFEFFKVKTVEALAELSDEIQRRMGPLAQEWRQKARDYLELTKGLAPMDAARKENDDLRRQLAVMQTALAAQGEKIADLQRGKAK